MKSIIKLNKSVLKEQAILRLPMEKILKTLEYFDLNGIRYNISVDLQTKFPLKKISKLEKLETDLQDTTVFDSLVEKFRFIGGTNAEQFSTLTARSLFNGKLISKCSLCGKREKR